MSLINSGESNEQTGPFSRRGEKTEIELNAGGMLYTCKSNGSIESLLSDGEWRTGE